MQVDDVDTGVREYGAERRRQDVHEPGTHYQVRRLLKNQLRQVAVVFFARDWHTLRCVRVSLLVRDEVVVGCRDVGVAGALQAIGVFAVGDDARDGRARQRRCVTGADEGLQIGAAAGDEDQELVAAVG